MTKSLLTARVYPRDLRDFDIWVVWARDSKRRKRPRAPWLTEHGYPVAWGADADERPETSYETAEEYAALEPTDLEATIAFEPDIPEARLELGVLLPHDPEDVFGDDRRLMQIDFDDVRDPSTGTIHPAAREIVKRAGSYASLSTSGKGVHVLVWARLPEDRGRHIGKLGDEPIVGDKPPKVELYDHGRLAALTGLHVDVTPLEVAEAQSLVDEIVEEYPDEDVDRELEGGASIDRIPRSGGSGKSPYYDEPVYNFAPPRANVDKRRSAVQGCHPVHGGTSSDDDSSSNYNVDLDKNLWYCFAHRTGGGPLKMVAQLEGLLDCSECSPGALDRIDDDDFLELCFAARDRYGFSGDPPYRALVAIARRHGLAFANSDEDVLGKSAYSVARQIYRHSP